MPSGLITTQKFQICLVIYCSTINNPKISLKTTYIYDPTDSVSEIWALFSLALCFMALHKTAVKMLFRAGE